MCSCKGGGTKQFTPGTGSPFAAVHMQQADHTWTWCTGDSLEAQQASSYDAFGSAQSVQQRREEKGEAWRAWLLATGMGGGPAGVADHDGEGRDPVSVAACDGERGAPASVAAHGTDDGDPANVVDRGGVGGDSTGVAACIGKGGGPASVSARAGEGAAEVWPVKGETPLGGGELKMSEEIKGNERFRFPLGASRFGLCEALYLITG